MLLNILTIIFLLLILICMCNPTNIEGLSSAEAGTIAGQLPTLKKSHEENKKKIQKLETLIKKLEDKQIEVKSNCQAKSEGNEEMGEHADSAASESNKALESALDATDLDDN